MPKPTLYRYRDDNGHHVSLPYTPERVANDPNMAGLTHLADHPAVDINGNALPPKINITPKAKRTARPTKTSPAPAEDRPSEAAVSTTKANEEATK